MNTMVIDESNSSENKALVLKCLHAHEDLKPLCKKLLDIIALLEDLFIKEDVILSALSLLRSRAQYDLDITRVREFATDMTTLLPRSLRTKTKIVSRTAIVRKPEFRAVEEMANEATEVWRKAMKNRFRLVRELERSDSCTSHTENFYKTVDSLISFKTTYEYERLSNIQKKVFKNSKKSLMTLAWLKIFSDVEEGNEPVDSMASEKTNVETSQTTITNTTTTTTTTTTSDKEPDQPSAAKAIEAESTPADTDNALVQVTRILLKKRFLERVSNPTIIGCKIFLYT